MIRDLFFNNGKDNKLVRERIENDLVIDRSEGQLAAYNYLYGTRNYRLNRNTKTINNQVVTIYLIIAVLAVICFGYVLARY